MVDFKKIEGISNPFFADIESSHVGDSYRIFVAPTLAAEPGKKYPVLYALDGNANYASAEAR